MAPNSTISAPEPPVMLSSNPFHQQEYRCPQVQKRIIASGAAETIDAAVPRQDIVEFQPNRHIDTLTGPA